MAGIPRSDITKTLGLSTRELSSREAAMLGKLEVLPGEASAPRRGQVARLVPWEFPSTAA